MTRLIHRAILTTAAMVLDHFARVITQIILAPLLISLMGASGFGLWQWFQKAFINLSTLDGRAGETIKWYVATKQEDKHTKWKQHVLGASFITYGIFFPIFISAIFIFYFSLSEQIKVDLGSSIAGSFAAIMALAVFIQGFASIYQGVLRGQNLGYKRMGVNVIIIVVTATLMVMMVKLGHGFIGLSIAQLIGSLLLLVLNIRIVKKVIPWLKPRLPSKELQQRFTMDSFWMSLWEFINFILLSGEIVVLGFFVLSALVSSYYLTAFASQLLVVALSLIITAMLPGLAGIYGKGDATNFIRIKDELSNYTWLLSTMLGTLVVLFNELFITIWVGREHYAGLMENIFIVILAWQLVYVRYSATMLSISLKIKEKVFAGLISLTSVLLLSSIMVPKFEIVGLCASFFFGRTILHGIFVFLLRKEPKYCSASLFTLRSATQWLLTLITIFVAIKISGYLQSDSISEYVLKGSMYWVVSFFVLIYTGWTKNIRMLAYKRTKTIIHRQ